MKPNAQVRSRAGTKGESTRAAALERAADLASRIGLQALSIGGLAEELGMSKSGLFAHFGSKEALQVQTLERAADRFTDQVVRPALEAPAGEPRVQALFDGWVEWERSQVMKGCIFVQSSSEFDDQPGAVRDTLEMQQRQWLGFLSNAAERAVAVGHFREDLDCIQFAFEFYSLLIGYGHAHRMMRDPSARDRLRTAFDRLLTSARKSL